MADLKISLLDEKTAPVDADQTNILDSAAANADKRMTLANLRKVVVATAGSNGDVADFDANGKVKGSGVATANIVTAASTITANALAKGDGSKGLSASGVTDDGTDLSCGDRLVSRLGLKGATQSTATYTLQASDNGTRISFDNAAGCVVTFPDSLGAGFNCLLEQLHATNPVSWAAGGGAAIQAYPAGADQTAGQYAVATVFVRSNAGGSAAVYNVGGAVEVGA